MDRATPAESHPEVGVDPQGHTAVIDPQEDELYGQACVVLTNQETRGQKRATPWLLLATMVLFAAGLAWVVGFSSLTQILWFVPLVIAVILLHEAGHYWGMRLFGYRDLRMFFIPFFGAAVSGDKHTVPAWQEAIVLLLGPLPGIVLGVLLSIFHPPWLTIPLALFLVLINGFNLLPFAPLDGGKLLQLLIFSRHPLWESAFLVFSGVGIAIIGWMQAWWVLVMLGSALVIGTPFYYGERRRRLAIGRELPQLPAKISELSDMQRRVLFRGARLLDPDSVDPNLCAKEMKSLHAERSRKPTGIVPSVALLTLYLAGGIAVLWSLSAFFYWGEADQPGAWSQRRIEALVKGELRLAQISLAAEAPGRYVGTGHTATGTKWTLMVVQNKENQELRWEALSENGNKRVGRLRMINGVLLDETPR